MRKRSQYYVNALLLGNNSIWDSSIILSVVFIWEKKVLWDNQQYNALNVYKKLGIKNGTIMENILEWII